MSENPYLKLDPLDNSSIPYYNASADYETNSPSYYDDLARKNELLKILANRIWEYDTILANKLAEIDSTMKEYEAIIDGKVDDFDRIILEKTQTWLDKNMDDILSDAIQTVWFGLNDEGYFIAVIPESWNEISFDTNANGQLILTY